MMFVHPRLAPYMLLFVSVVVGGACNYSSHPTDNEMEAVLKSNQSDLETLVTMLFEDQDIVRLDEKYVFLSEGSYRDIPQERLRTYRNLFQKLELQRGFQRDKDNALRFIASSGGIFSSSEKSFIYSTTPLTPLVDSLDSIIKRDRGDQSPVFKKLSGSWYLYYASW